MKIEKGTIVSVKYKVDMKETGETVDENTSDKPLVYMAGSGQMIPGFDEEMMGAEVGEKREFLLEPARAYGEHIADGIRDMPKGDFPEGIEVGMMLYAELENGQQIPFVIKAINEETITADLNHPLAGKHLMFNVEVLELREASEEELAHGHAHGPGAHSLESESKKECNDDGCC